jgi:hypothetical protein
MSNGREPPRTDTVAYDPCDIFEALTEEPGLEE